MFKQRRNTYINMKIDFFKYRIPNFNYGIKVLTGSNKVQYKYEYQVQ